MWNLPLDSFSRYPFFSDPSLIMFSALESPRTPSRHSERSEESLFASSKVGTEDNLSTISLPLAPMLRIVVLKRVCAACSRPSNAVGSNGVRFLSGKDSSPAARLGELLFESLTFQTA